VSEADQALTDADPKLTLSVYAREMRRTDGERERLRALVAGAEAPDFAASMRHEEALNARARDD
jgi:hypothetical protein